MTRAFVRALTLAAMALSTTLPAHATSENGLRAEVLVCGSLATEYSHLGTTYVEARDGCEYAIRLTNDTGYRLAVHLSVDGLNTIDASDTSPSRGPRWVLEPYQQATISGWQTGMDSSRRFYFTTADQSYSRWMGDTSDAGRIRVVAYREKRSYNPPPVYIEPGWDRPSRKSGGWDDWDGSSAEESESRSKRSGSSADAPAAGAAEADALRYRGREYTPRDDRAATGIGREVGSHVNYTSFDAESRPSARVTLRYGYQDQLVAWGVFPRPYSCRCCYDGFAPDPSDWRCR